MRNIYILFFVLFTINIQAQYTLVPDVNFEGTLFNMDLDDILGDQQVPTSAIDT